MKSGFIKNLAEAGFYTYLSAIFRFVVTLVLARILVPEEFGLIAMIQVFSGLILILRDAGFSVAVIRGNVGLNNEELHLASLGSGILFFFLMLGLSFYLPFFYDTSEVKAPAQAIAFVFIFSSLTTVPQAILRKQLEFKKLGRFNLISEIISSGICVLAALAELSYWSLVIRELLFYLVLFLLFRKSLKLARVSSMKNFMGRLRAFSGVAGKYGSIQILEYGARNIDNLLIGKIQGERDLGLYSRAYSLIYISHTFLLGIINSVMFPTLEAEGKEAMQKFLLTFLGLSLATSLINLVFMIFPNEIVIILWGSKWLDLVPYIPYIGIAIFIQIPFGMFANVFMANKKDSTLLKLTIVKFLIIGISIFVGVFDGIETLLQWYTGGFILYGGVLLLILKKSISIRGADLSPYWIAIVVSIFLLSYQLFSWSISLLICVWFFHFLYLGTILWSNYRRLKSIG